MHNQTSVLRKPQAARTLCKLLVRSAHQPSQRCSRKLSSSVIAPHGVRKELSEHLEEFIKWRKDFHAHPELGFEEFRTSELVTKRLREFGVDNIQSGVGGTGVVGTIVGNLPDSNSIISSVGLRADMDALPMFEEIDSEYKSVTPGKFHGCGHDGHTTMLLAAGKYLSETRNFAGSVHLIFQPAEEGLFGAQAMLDDGLFDRFPCDEVYGLHNWPDLPAGEWGVCTGPVMAAADRFEITVHGKGGHGAMPHACVDPVAVAAQTITAIQTIVARNVDPTETAVVSVTQVHGGHAFNVIPHHVDLKGTIRTFSEATRDLVHQRLRDVCTSVAAGMQATVTVEIHAGYPATVNHVEQTEYAAAAAARVVGNDNVARNPPRSMAAEDFSMFMHHVPGCYAWLGQGSQRGNLHNPQYDFNDDIIPIGASWFVEVVEDRLGPS
eukprot:m.331896 g.331896  ORF g.331896 m.331896 type:complete len:437 (+) comp20488_c1_seq1:430-1740(+)